MINPADESVCLNCSIITFSGSKKTIPVPEKFLKDKGLPINKAAYINTNPNKKRDILISIFFMSKYTSTANAITAKAYIKNTSIILPLHSLYTFC